LVSVETIVVVTMKISHHAAELELLQVAVAEIKAKLFHDLSHCQAIRKALLTWTNQPATSQLP
jgi:hypothetical protein